MFPSEKSAEELEGVLRCLPLFGCCEDGVVGKFKVLVLAEGGSLVDMGGAEIDREFATGGRCDPL